MSRVVIAGGAGFIGRTLAAALATRGHSVSALSRAAFDLTRIDAETAAKSLVGADCVVNCAGVLGAGKRGDLDALHAHGTAVLVDACRRAGVRRLLHVSALGAGASGATEFLRSKGRGEALLDAAADLDVCVLRPSIVIGRGGASTALFAALAALPMVPRLASGPIAPIGIDDLCEIVARLIERPGALPRALDAVGPETLSVDEIVDRVGVWLGLRSRGSFRLLGRALAGLVRLGALLKLGPVTPEALAMLRAGNVSDSTAAGDALGRAPLPIDRAMALHPAAPADRLQARLYFICPLLRLSLAALWLTTGVLSCLDPAGLSRPLLDEIGLRGAPASAALYSGAGLDLLLGLLLLAGWRTKTVGALMLASMAAFTTLALRLPAELWLHPFAPLLKNLPIAAAILAMMAMED